MGQDLCHLDNDNDNDNMFYFLLINISRKLISICQDIYFPTHQQEKGASEAQLINDAPFFTITISYINRRDIFTFQYLIAYSAFDSSSLSSGNLIFLPHIL